MAVFAERLTEDNSIIELFLLADSDNNRCADLPRKIGFDKVTVGLNVYQVDWDVLETIETSEAGERRTLFLRTCRDEEKILAMCKGAGRSHWYSEIKVQLASNVFTMRKCNLPNARDICSFEICIPPIERHECLGNISNLSCEQEQMHVQHMMDILEQYGIYVERDTAILKRVELNINLYFDEKTGDFCDAVEMLRPYRHGLDDRFVFSDFSKKTTEDQLYVELGLGSKNNAYRRHNIGVMKRQMTSFNSIGRSLEIKIYDKSSETIEKSHGYIGWMTPITRIEFVITSPKLVPFYMGDDNLFALNQGDVEEAFNKLAKKYIKEPLIYYYRKMYAAFEKYFENVDIGEYAWRKNLVRDLDNTIKRTDDLFVLAEADLKRLVKLIPNFSDNTSRTRVFQTLKEEFERAECIRIADGWDIGLLLNWLCDFHGEEPQSIIYALKPREEDEEDGE